MKIKVSEATPLQLDWLVAKIEGPQPRLFEPSTNWSHGGPIIEREGIELLCNHPVIGGKDPAWGVWDGFACSWKTRSLHYHGPTPLIAAMRCYVASKLGDEVEVPEELK